MTDSVYVRRAGIYDGRGKDRWILSEPWIDNAKPELDCGPIAVAQALHVQSLERFNFNNAPDTSGVISGGMKTGTGLKCAGSVASPASAHDRALNLIYLIRRYAGSTCNGGNSITQLHRAYVGFTAEFASLYVSPPRATLFAWNSWTTDFLPAMLVAGTWAVIFIWYPALIALQPELLNQCTPVQEHYITVGEYDGSDFTLLDPLADGRSAGACGGNVIAGAQKIHKATLKAAASAIMDNPGRSTTTGLAAFFTTKPSHDIFAGDHYCDTNLVTASTGGATNFKVSSVTGMFAGDALQVGVCPDTEQLVILTVGTAGSGGTGVTTTAGAAHAHAVGNRLVTGGYDPDPPCGSDPFTGWDPCNDSA